MLVVVASEVRDALGRLALSKSPLSNPHVTRCSPQMQGLAPDIQSGQTEVILSASARLFRLIIVVEAFLHSLFILFYFGHILFLTTSL